MAQSFAVFFVGEDGPGDGAKGPAASAGLFAVFAGQGVLRGAGCRGDGGIKVGENVERGWGIAKSKLRSRTPGLAGGLGSCWRPLFKYRNAGSLFILLTPQLVQV